MASTLTELSFLFLLSILTICSSGVSSLNPAPTIINVPSTNPITGAPNPAANTVTVPNNTPVTNPAANPTPPGGAPVATPGTTPPAAPNAPAVSGQSFCVAKSGAPQTALQAALDYACGKGADCSAIQQGGSCYNPNTLQNHASYAFNSYYLKNPAPTSCDFGGVATLTNANPSTGSCVFPTSSSSSSPPATGGSPTPPGTTAYPPPTAQTPPGTTYPPPTAQTPPGATYPPPTAQTPGAIPGSGTPFGMNSSNPGSGGVFPESNGPTVSTSASSSRLQPSISCILLVVSIITLKQVLNI